MKTPHSQTTRGDKIWYDLWTQHKINEFEFDANEFRSKQVDMLRYDLHMS